MIITRNRALEIAEWFFLFTSAIGGSMGIELVRIENPDFTLPSIIMGIGFAGFLIIEFHKYRTTPKAVREEGKKAERPWIDTWQVIETNILWVVFFTGIIAEFTSFMQSEYSIFVVTVYLSVSLALFFKYRKKIATFRWVFLFHLAIALVAPIVTFTWIYPELLSQTGMFDVYGSREYSYLIFLYLQSGLFISTLFSAIYSWRTGVLIKMKLGVKELIKVQRDFLVSVKDEDLRNDLREIVLDVATLRETILNGQFATTCGWGWSIIDRLLGKLDSGENLKEKAENMNLLTERFRKSYKIRNRTVHGGHKPTFDEAVSVLELIRETLTKLTSRNQQANEESLNAEKLP